MLACVVFIIFDQIDFWKPKGKIIYVKLINSTMALYIMDPDGSHVDRLTGDDVRVEAPVWSPDGKEIAFGCSSPNGIDLCVGKFIQRRKEFDVITPMETLLLFDGLHIHAAEDETCQYPIKTVSWAPDQQRLAFVCSGPQAVNLGHPDLICITDRSGTADCFSVTELYDDLAAENLEVEQIAWSPIEDVLAISFWVASIEGSARREIYLVDLHGQSIQFLASGWRPAWAVDGKRIYFWDLVDDHLSGIAVINKDGNNSRIVYRYPVEGTEGVNHSVFVGSNIMPTGNSVLALSSDEHYIATNAFRGGIKNSAIYLIDLKTQKVLMLTVYGDGEVFAPDWSP